MPQEKLKKSLDHNMKKFVVATLLAGMAFGANAADTIRFAASATYPPFESLDANNEIVGFDMDLAKALCKQMQANCTFTNQAFDSLISALKFRRYDAVISRMDITPERSKQVAFTQPYYANSAVVIAQKGKFSDFAAMKGKRIGMENCTTHQKYMTDIAKRLNFDYTIWTENKLSVSQPISLFLLFACAHLCSIGLRSGEYVGKYSTIYPASMMTC